MSKPLNQVFIAAPDVFEGDAVGNHCLYLAKDLTDRGVLVRLFARNRAASNNQVEPLDALFQADTENATLLVSYSIHDPQLAQYLDLKTQRSVCYFHGVTPPSLLREYEPVTADLCERSYGQLPEPKGFDQVLCNSDFNRKELAVHTGRNDIGVLPPISPSQPIFQTAIPAVPSDPTCAQILMIGRIVPHKRIEDGIRMTATLRLQGTICRLVVVGSCHNAVYMAYLQALSEELNVAAFVSFEGAVSDERLQTLMGQSNVLLCASLHEGFCVPVLEAMFKSLPVVLRRGTAAQEVGESAALEFTELEEGEQALMQALVDPVQRTRMVKCGRLKAAKWLESASAQHWMARLSVV